MTTSRERVIKTLNHEPVDRTPRDLWVPAATETLLGDEVTEMRFRYANDFERPEFRYPRGRRTQGNSRDAGTHTDAWGCTWHVAKRGAPRQLKLPPLADTAAIAAYRPPDEILEALNPDRVNRQCAKTSRFVLAESRSRPFDRLRLLRGAEVALMDLASGTRPVRDLLAMLHDFTCREMEFWASTNVDGVALGDDWSSPFELLLPRELWRELFGPLYRDYCRILHAKDKFVFFHSAGHNAEIFGDLARLGVDAIHAQLFAMDVEKLAARYRGEVTFWGEIDRERILRFGSPEDVRAAVYRVRKAFDFGRGGVIAQCQWDAETPFANIAAVFERWLEPMLAHA